MWPLLRFADVEEYKQMEKYSVLMLVYKGEDPASFREAIQSMLDQTVPTDDFVIVCDGPLTAELDGVLDTFVSRYPDLFHIVRLPENVGEGLAGNPGVRACRNELVAKMDSDDISLPDRCEKQLARFAANPELILVGGVIEEFDNETGAVCAARTVPLDNAGIRRFARRRSPFNNVTVMYRKAAVLAAGGYRDLRRGTDYDLYLRMLINGCYAENLPDTLVRVRVEAGDYGRRASWRTLKACASIWWNAWRKGFSSLADLVICLAGQTLLIICPAGVQQMLYQKFLRRNVTLDIDEK